LKPILFSHQSLSVLSISLSLKIIFICSSFYAENDEFSGGGAAADTAAPPPELKKKTLFSKKHTFSDIHFSLDSKK
jgi:hypothetical protein